MTRVSLKGHILVPAAELSMVENELPNHILLTREEPGCLVFEVTQDQVDPCKFHVDELFEDQMSFARHQQRVKASRWGRATGSVERFYDINGA